MDSGANVRLLEGMITAAFLALLANSAYLAAFATPSLFYFANVALHVLLGIVLAVVAMRRAVRARDALSRIGWSAAILLGAGTLSGLVVTCNRPTCSYRWRLPTPTGLMLSGTDL